MPSRVRVAAVIGGRVYFGRRVLSTLVVVLDNAGIIAPKKGKELTWKVVLEFWGDMSRHLPDCKLYIIRERRGLKASRSLFNYKLLGYRRKKKKKLQLAVVAPVFDWNANANDAPAQPLEVPVRRRRVEVNPLGQVVYENIDGN